jgi:hypothetical protein
VPPLVSQSSVLTEDLLRSRVYVSATISDVLFAAIKTSRGRCFVDDDLAKTGTFGFQFLPEPFRHSFNRGILQAFDVIEIRMVQHFQERFHRVADIRVIVNPAGFWIDIAFHGNFHLETVSMHPSAFMTLRRIGQSLRSFKSEIFG